MTLMHWQPLGPALGAAVGIGSGLYAARAVAAARLDAVPNLRGSAEPPRLVPWAIGIGAIAGVAVGARFGVSLELVAHLLLLVAAVPLSAIDLAVRKVPDRILLPAFPAAIALLTLAAYDSGDYGALERAILAAIVSFAAYLALALASGQVGLGDCKAAGFCGIYLGFLGWKTAAYGAILAFVLAGAVAVVRVASSSSGAARDKTLAFAPFIFAGALVAVLMS